ncbi:MAG TPA: IS630 family transposase [Candidatus Woesebacteria bacterium]|nr:IS630 family transposase [Candidatus Woesebacteria bacterium]
MQNIFEIDPKVRCIVLHNDAQWTARRISEGLQIPERTIRDWINKVDKGINILEVQAGRGRNPTISESTKDKVVRTVRRKPLISSTRNLSVQYNMAKDSVNRTLKSRNYKYGKAKEKIQLEETEKKDRVNFCRNMLKRRGEPLEEIFFSDEMGMRLSEAYNKKGWTGPYKKLKVEKPRKDIKVNCWGAISKNGATSLEIFTETLDAPLYIDIVTEHIQEMQELYPRGFLFQHDNLSAHKKAEVDLKRHGLNFVKFPTYSPDLSPIENLWGTLKERVRKDNPKNENQLIRSLRNNWESLTTGESLKPYFDGLYDRYMECIEINGELL